MVVVYILYDTVDVISKSRGIGDGSVVVSMHKQGGMVVSCPYSWVWCN